MNDVGSQIDVAKSSIVAIHGLGGDATKTWTHPQNGAYWLKDFLPADVPGARIFTFGYNANVVFGNSTANIRDHAKELLSSLIDERVGATPLQ